MQAVDILILSNGPGEIVTWVRPMLRSLREKLGNDRSQVRISLILSPCPHGTGKESEIALSYPEVDRVQDAKYFFPFLLWGKTAENWEWRDRGVVLFLGGDQFFTVVIGKRLNYRTVTYAEWDARWHQLIDRFGVMKPEIIAKVAPKYAHKFSIVGDLMIEAQQEINTQQPESKVELIGILPGSKAAKLAQGLPFILAIAERIHQQRPQTRFVLPVAPSLDLATLASFGDPQQNPVIHLVEGTTAQLFVPEPPDLPYLKTGTGLYVELSMRSPDYELLAKCCLCLTTIGANTAELGALAVPMIVVIPTQQLDAMRAWGGIPGILANLPLLGSLFAKIINWIALQRIGLLAWPNRWAKEEIVPELVGKLQPQPVAEIALDLLKHPEKLEAMRDRLRRVRGKSGASQRLAEIVQEELIGAKSQTEQPQEANTIE